MTQKRVKIIVFSDAPLKTQSNDTLFELLQAIWIFSKFISCPVLKLQQTLWNAASANSRRGFNFGNVTCQKWSFAKSFIIS